MTPAELRARVEALAMMCAEDVEWCGKKMRESTLPIEVWTRFDGRRNVTVSVLTQLRALLSEYDASARGDNPCG